MTLSMFVIGYLIGASLYDLGKHIVVSVWKTWYNNWVVKRTIKEITRKKL